MKLKFWYCPIIALFIYVTNSQVVYSTIAETNKDKSTSLSVDYLKNLPSNDYIIGPGDQLKIVISRDYPELSSATTVDGEGTIYLPRLNRIYVNELSINELNEILNKAYSEFVRFPSVEVEIIKYRPIKVFVDGEVRNPGLVTLAGSLFLKNDDFVTLSNTSRSLNNSINKTDEVSFNYFGNTTSNYFPTVFDAIRESGGVTQYSNLANIQVIRKNNLSNGSGKISTTINLENVLLTGDNSQNIRIYDSDIIKITKSDKANKNMFYKGVLSNLNPKFLNVFVFGRVNNPGNVKVSRLGALSDAIEIAGGAKLVKGKLTFLRFNNDGTIDKRKFRYKRNANRGSFKNPLLEEGDLIVIGNSPLSLANEIITEVTSPFVGIFSTYGLIQAINN